MAAHAERGKQALAAGQYDSSVAAYSEAIKEFPGSPDYFIQRSTALQRLQRFNEALADAEQAVLNAQNRARRDLVVDAQFRRGVALWHLGRLGDAAFLFSLVLKMKPDYKMAPIWARKTELSLAALPDDDERRNCSISETPNPPDRPASDLSNSTAAGQSASSTAPSDMAQTPANKIRHEWYQNTEHVYVTLLVKGVPSDKAAIEISERSLSISFPLANGSTYEFTLEPLFAAVNTAKSITRILPTKVEVVLVKASPQKWSALESSQPVPASSNLTTSSTSAVPSAAIISETSSKPVDSAPASKAPAYPTSSKSGPKNWDTIAQADDDDDEGGDAANSFFKKLFKGADPDTQRAMMKSYTESSGTSLSTNWEEVSKGPVATVPPDGMEAKKW